MHTKENPEVKNVPELHEKVQQMGVEDVKYESLKEAGVNLRGLVHIWGIGYLSGGKEERIVNARY